jgi:hypothetical protein
MFAGLLSPLPLPKRNLNPAPVSSYLPLNWPHLDINRRVTASAQILTNKVNEAFGGKQRINKRQVIKIWRKMNKRKSLDKMAEENLHRSTSVVIHLRKLPLQDFSNLFFRKAAHFLPPSIPRFALKEN